jgi:hypothetical protein
MIRRRDAGSYMTLENLDRLLGMVPLNRLLDRYSSWREVRLDSASGIVPESRFVDRYRPLVSRHTTRATERRALTLET